MLQEALLALTLCYSLVSLCIMLLCEVAPRAFLESLELMYFPVSGPCIIYFLCLEAFPLLSVLTTFYSSFWS